MGPDPWGLTGAQFLEWYFVGIGAAIVLALVIRNLPKLAGDPIHGVRPSAVDAGWLAGGPGRAVEAAIAGMLASGALRADSGGLLRSTGAVTARDGLTADILARTQAGHSFPDVIEYLGRRTALWEVGAGLAEQGLLLSPRAEKLNRLLAAVPTLGVLIVGIVRLVNGISLSRPVGFLWLSLIGTVILLFVLVVTRRRSVCTGTGRRVLRELRRMPSPDVATTVALRGLRHYPDVRIAEALRRSEVLGRRQRTMATSSGAAAGFFIGGGGGGGCGGGGGGGGCGGGGGGGGGCGGCGG
ncbi:TIGR04222 domain-containing membrane protein [Kutzneria buriramensis]|uniref:Uncharacterized protein (TIGR04222 family) n=1 Tax=Kutzneria buriramensis TaxID=1045776 RepID=A0A3E0HZB3_9PSEU|nr:TIGR04222 domain-containing membrane protein [Kutzneria buriramensis]REH51813.1 uncharacterized protein (TIGR04222 family) [Kutzneria buriramensis]